MWGVVHSALDEVGQPGLVGKASRNVNGCAREVESGGHRATSDQAERVFPNMALQVEDALCGNIANFGSLDQVQGILARSKGREPVEAGGIAPMNDGTLVPISAIDFNRIDHGIRCGHIATPYLPPVPADRNLETRNRYASQPGSLRPKYVRPPKLRAKYPTENSISPATALTRST
jgi:hypothetical protein